MTEYAICFDFPENDDPVFAWLGRNGLGFTFRLDDAMRFDTERVAERTLANGYGKLGEFGSVVEMGT